MLIHISKRGACCAAALALAFGAAFSQEPAGKPRKPVEVKIVDEKPVVLEGLGGIDPQPQIQAQSQGNMYLNLQKANQRISFMQTNFQFDGQVLFPGNPNTRIVAQNQPLPAGKNKKPRTGFLCVCEIGKLTITQEVEIVPTKARPDEKRKMDSAMVRYLVENKDTQPHKFGIRVIAYSFLTQNRAIPNAFVSPADPTKILDGVELKAKDVPSHVKIMQKPDVKDPGLVAHLTCNLGRSFAVPDRVVLTGQNALNNINQWDMQALKAQGFSLMGIFWDPQEIKAGGKRQMAIALGEGIALGPEGEGQFVVALGGSFEPGKLFTVAAYVQDPAPGQTLSLELPAGMQHVEGKERQPVPEVDEDGNAMVFWKARVLDTGKYDLRVRSSTGITQTKIITISRPE